MTSLADNYFDSFFEVLSLSHSSCQSLRFFNSPPKKRGQLFSTTTWVQLGISCQNLLGFLQLVFRGHGSRCDKDDLLGKVIDEACWRAFGLTVFA